VPPPGGGEKELLGFVAGTKKKRKKLSNQNTQMFEWDLHSRAAVAVTGAVLLFSWLTAAMSRSDRQPFERAARGMLEQTAQRARMSEQDADPAIALQHLTEAVAHAEIACQLVDVRALQRVGTDVHGTIQRLRARQGALLQQLRKK